MATPPISELVTTTIQNRRRALADNMTNNTMLLKRLRERGNADPANGGTSLWEELDYEENATYKRFSDYEVIDIRPSNTMTAAEFDWKQAAVVVTISERQKLINSGRERMINLLKNRIKNGERTFINNLSADAYSDGTSDGGKQITGVGAMLPTSGSAATEVVRVDTGTYGGINRNTFAFWRPLYFFPTDAFDIRQAMMRMWVNLCRNMDKIDLIPCDNLSFEKYWAALSEQQRFTKPSMGRAGFTNLAFVTADVVLDGGLNGNADANTMYFLNTNYLHWRPHPQANLAPVDTRMATNQLAEIRPLHFMGNLTCSNQALQGRLNTTNCKIGRNDK